MHFIKAKSILNQPGGMNIYRGCTHGCIYCDSRSLCYQINHNFEDVEVKENAPELLEAALQKKRAPCVIWTGAMSDPYCHAEEELQLTRRCLEIIRRHNCGLSVLTKSARALRDAELFREIHLRAKCTFQMTVTTADDGLCRILEPNVSPTSERIAALSRISGMGIPTVVWFTPLLPYINDTEENVRNVVRLCAEAGVYGIITFGMGVTLRAGDREYFYRCLDRHFPGLKERYIRNFGDRYEIESENSARLWEIFDTECDRYRIRRDTRELFDFIGTITPSAPSEQLTLPF